MSWTASDSRRHDRFRMHRTGMLVAAAAGLAALACGAGPGGPAVHPAAPMFEERFERLDAVLRGWTVSPPQLAGTTVEIQDGAARLTLPAAGDLRLRHRLDPASV